MSDQEQNVTLRDVYDLVGEAKKESSTQFEKVNGDITDLKVSVGKVETKLDGQDVRISANENALGTLRNKIHDQRVRAAQIGGLAGVVITAILRGIEWLLAQAGA